MSYSSEVLADSPIGYWRLEEAAAATTVVDSSGNGRDGTAVNSPDFHHASQVGFGVQGTHLLWSDSPAANQPRIDIADNAAWDVTDLTIEGWVKVPSFSGPGDGSVYSYTPILTRSSLYSSLTPTADRDDYAFYLYAEDSSSGYWAFDLFVPFTEFGGGTATGIVGSFSLVATYGVWNHAVAVVDSVGLTVKFYWNGVEAYSQDNTWWPISGFTFRPSANKLRLLAPRNADDSDPGVPGYADVDEIAIYNTALSAARIAAHYSAATGNSDATPSVVAGVGAVPAPTATGIQNAAPASVAGILAVPQPSVSGGGAATANPSVTAGIGSVPAPTGKGAGNAVPARVLGTGLFLRRLFT